MADFDSHLPVRSDATNFTTEVANASGSTINPVEEFSQGSASAGQNGPLMQGAVTTSAPSYTSGNTDPISLTPVGAVRVDGSATTQPVSGTVTANQGTSPWVTNVAQIGGSALTEGQKTMAASVPVVIASDQSTINVNTNPPTEQAPDFKHAVGIAANASDTHSFTPVSTINLDKIVASASGSFKCEIQWGTTGSETSKAVFFGSASHQWVELELPNPVSIPNTSTIKVIMTNREPVTAQDLYSSIIYH